jgi:hypothetical protein
VAAIVARRRPERVEAAALVRVVPALEGGERELLRHVRARRPEALARERAERRPQLAAVHVLARERTDELGAEASDRLGVVLRRERR